MKYKLYVLIAGLSVLSGGWAAATPATKALTEPLAIDIQTALQACRKQSSPLPRLQCYDDAWHPELKTAVKVKPDRSWWQVTSQEQARKPDDPVLLLKPITGEAGISSLLLTVPGNGNYPARATLAISCIENITRMQIVFNAPQGKGDQILHLIANGKSMPGRWFWRGSGYRLEASRGLQGIEEIQQLFGAQELEIAAEHPALNNLRFRIDGLKVAIEPLRKACHW